VRGKARSEVAFCLIEGKISAGFTPGGGGEITKSSPPGGLFLLVQAVKVVMGGGNGAGGRCGPYERSQG